MLVDKEGLVVLNSESIPSSIDDLDTIRRPAIGIHSKRTQLEKLKITVDAYIIARGKEDDGDYHLVLQNLAGTKTLIAEIPSSENEELKNHKTLMNLYKKSRSFIDSAMGVPTRKITALRSKRKVKVTGILFFDKLSHGKGHAPNGVEIHPVLEIIEDK